MELKCFILRLNCLISSAVMAGAATSDPRQFNAWACAGLVALYWVILGLVGLFCLMCCCKAEEEEEERKRFVRLFKDYALLNYPVVIFCFLFMGVVRDQRRGSLLAGGVGIMGLFQLFVVWITLGYSKSS